MKHDFDWYFKSHFYDFILELVQKFDLGSISARDVRLALEDEYQPLDDLFWEVYVAIPLFQPQESQEYRADMMWDRVLK